MKIAMASNRQQQFHSAFSDGRFATLWAMEGRWIDSIDSGRLLIYIFELARNWTTGGFETANLERWPILPS
jgi:hypothetical protein